MGLVALCSACAGRPGDVRPPGRPEPGLELPWGLATCLDAAADVDADGLSDVCEIGLARAFAPALIVTPGGCDWNDGPSRPAGAYLFGVQPDADQRVRIAYLPAYFRDCGWRGPKCLLPGSGCRGHSGDSELVALSVRADGRRWWVEELVVSAHCFGRTRGCAWRAAAWWESWVDNMSAGAPVVFVAEGTHAGYPSRSACDAGHYGMDTCDRARVGFRFPIRSHAQNIGSRTHPLAGDGCLTASELPLGASSASAEAPECIWAGEGAFRGWQADASGAPPTPYGRYLAEVLGW